jgi:hypothetical protein
VDQHAQRLGLVVARIDRDDGNTGFHSRAHRGAERVGVRHADDEAVRVRSHRRVDELGHRHHVERFGGLIFDAHAQVAPGLPRAVLDYRPERVGRLPVGDEHDAQIGRSGFVVARPAAGAGRQG